MEDSNIYSPPNSDLTNTETWLEELSSYELASRWARLGAAILDAIVLTALAFTIVYLSGYWSVMISNALTIYEQIAWSLVGLATYLLVNGYLLHRYGQTVGKWVLGIKIVSAKDGKILPLWKIFFVRYIPQVLVSAIPIAGQFLLMIEYLFIFRKDKRCVHDLIAQTKVIKEYAH
jgi:uncharacterized RDD family membrane protein YckC